MGRESEGHEPFLPFFARGIMSDLAKALTFKGSKIIGVGGRRGQLTDDKMMVNVLITSFVFYISKNLYINILLCSYKIYFQMHYSVPFSHIIEINVQIYNSAPFRRFITVNFQIYHSVPFRWDVIKVDKPQTLTLIQHLLRFQFARLVSGKKKKSLEEDVERNTVCQKSPLSSL